MTRTSMIKQDMSFLIMYMQQHPQNHQVSALIETTMDVVVQMGKIPTIQTAECYFDATNQMHLQTQMIANSVLENQSESDILRNHAYRLLNETLEQPTYMENRVRGLLTNHTSTKDLLAHLNAMTRLGEPAQPSNITAPIAAELLKRNGWGSNPTGLANLKKLCPHLPFNNIQSLMSEYLNAHNTYLRDRSYDSSLEHNPKTYPLPRKSFDKVPSLGTSIQNTIQKMKRAPR